MHHLTRYDPFAETGFDELFRGCWKPLRASAAPAAASIRMDVTETDKGYVVHAEIPGAKKEDVNTSIEGNQVTIGAEIRRDCGPDTPVHLIAVLKGAFVFLADLLRQIKGPVTIDFIAVSSYGSGTASSG